MTPQALNPSSERENIAYAAYMVDANASALMRCLLDHAGRVCWLVLRRNSSDLVQEIAMHVYEKLPQFDGKSSFSTWAHSVMRHYCYNIRRTEKTRKEVPLEFAAEAIMPDAEERIIVAEMLARLPREDRMLLEQRLQGLTYDDIAKASGMSIDVLKKKVQEIVRGLRDVSK